MGLPEITRDQCRQFVGNGARVLMEKALMASGARDLSRIEEAMEIYGRIFHENCMYHVEPYAKIRELLEGLTEHQIERAVLSNKPHAQTVQVVQDVFGKELFSYVQGQCEGYPKKPDPTMVFEIARKLGRKIEECVYIGDSEVDIRTGSAAGMRTIGVTWGFRSKEELLEAGAVETVDDPLEILELIS
jgi:HAD hydrolase, family IA, variant 3